MSPNVDVVRALELLEQLEPELLAHEVVVPPGTPSSSARRWASPQFGLRPVKVACWQSIALREGSDTVQRPPSPILSLDEVTRFPQESPGFGGHGHRRAR